MYIMQWLWSQSSLWVFGWLHPTSLWFIRPLLVWAIVTPGLLRYYIEGDIQFQSLVLNIISWNRIFHVRVLTTFIFIYFDTIKKFQFLITEKKPFLKIRSLSFLDLPKVNCLEVYGEATRVSERATLCNEQQNWTVVNWVCRGAHGDPTGAKSLSHLIMLVGWVFQVLRVLELLLEQNGSKRMIKYCYS